MDKKYSTQSFNGVQMTQVSVNSPDQLAREQIDSVKNIKSNWWSCNIKRCAFLILLVLTSSLTLYQINTQKVRPPDPEVVIQGPFQFPIYCPYSYINDLMFGDDEDLRLRRLYNTYAYTLSVKDVDLYKLNQTYLVQIDLIEYNKTVGDKTTLQKSLFYCGLITEFGTTCSKNVKFRCSNPGPLFDLKTNQFADIVWINNIKTDSNTSFPSDTSSCMIKPSAWCDLQTKNDTSFTYLDPTDMSPEFKKSHTHAKVRISSKNWPTSAHVHGAQVRPTFDGNPMSWIDNSGNRGLGAFSLDDDCYYSQFDSDNQAYQPPDIIVNAINDEDYEINRTKISRYPNKQNPGNLWYHDHAMRLTLYNVRYGLAGLYILRDPQVEQVLDVPPQNQKFLMMTVSGWQNSRLQVEEETVYRFRILNSDFSGSLKSFSFTYGDCTGNQRIPFTQIGADSSLFNTGIQNLKEISLAAAQRAEILIIFQKGHQSYSICNSSSPVALKRTANVNSNYNPHDPTISIQTQTPSEYSRIGIRRKQKASTARSSINNIKLNVPYIDLSDPNVVAPSDIAVKRMRTLTGATFTTQLKPSAFYFMINGRIDFHVGQSENPKIGTLEDWYIINTFTNQHPIHIHLINFQVVKTMKLRTISGCSVYELDFIIEAMKTSSNLTNNTKYFPDQQNLDIVNYTNICTDKATIYAFPKFYENLALVNLQSQKDQNNVSGIDVQKPLTDLDRELLGITDPDQKYKYVLDFGSEPRQPHYKRWKDTASVDGLTVSVFRIRWAKSAYNQDNADDTYFHVPLDQLREFPGFVYHCHILGHQDSEMMRPIMLQLPDNAKLNNQIKCNKETESDKYFWKKKVNCINTECKKQPRPQDNY